MMSKQHSYTASAERFSDDTNDYWLGGVWDQDGHLMWSSEPESFDTETDALAAAQYRIDNDFSQRP